MYQKSQIAPLLESLVQDNPTYKFPVELIQKELINIFLSQEEFDYFMMQAYKKIKREYGSTIAHIFLTTLEMKLDLKNTDIHNLSPDDYAVKIEEIMSSFEGLYITRIDKKTPDGVLMSAMA